MREGYYAAGDEGGPYSGLDEFLCEYVDGTMDPGVRAVFEEYLSAHPDLREHVECLRRTRMMLCRYGCRRRAPEGIQARLHGRLGCEMMQAQSPLFATMTSRLGAFAAFTSAVVVMLAAGMVWGEVFLAERPAVLAEGNRPVQQEVSSGSAGLMYGRAGSTLPGWMPAHATSPFSMVGAAPALLFWQPASVTPSDTHAAVRTAGWERTGRVP